MTKDWNDILRMSCAAWQGQEKVKGLTIVAQQNGDSVTDGAVGTNDRRCRRRTPTLHADYEWMFIRLWIQTHPLASKIPCQNVNRCCVNTDKTDSLRLYGRAGCDRPASMRFRGHSTLLYKQSIGSSWEWKFSGWEIYLDEELGNRSTVRDL